MHTPLRMLIAALFLSVSLAGCLGGDEAPAPTSGDDGAEDPTVTEETGAVKGQIVTKDLDKVANAAVALVAPDGAISADTKTDQDGRFTFNGIEPGTYKVQVSALCCKAAVQNVEVEANAVADVNFQLETLSLDDLQAPYSTTDEWKGFISCGVSTPAVRAAACALLDGTPVEDPNEEFLKEFNVSNGLKTLIVAMDWTPVGGVSGGTFNLLIENEDCNVSECSYEYADLEGESPLIIRLDNDDITDPAHVWDAIEDLRTLQYRIFAGGDLTLVYQQPFTIYTHAFYWQEAPEDFSPIPDA